MDTKNFNYGNRFVAFIDILGFKQMIGHVEKKMPGHEQIFKRLVSVLNFLNEESIESNGNHDLPVYEFKGETLVERELGNPRITYISDCVIVSTDPDFDGFKSICNKLTKFSTDLACDGMFLRGAITYGPLFHDMKFVFGSAYQRAYEIESKLAVHPRILVDQSVLDFLHNRFGEFPLNDTGTTLGDDGLRYLSCFPFQYHPMYTFDWVNFLLRVKGHILYALNLFDPRISGYPKPLQNLDRYYCWREACGTTPDFSGSDERVFQKYLWLKDEFNKTLVFYHKFLLNGSGQVRIAKIIDLGSHWGPETILGQLR